MFSSRQTLVSVLFARPFVHTASTDDAAVLIAASRPASLGKRRRLRQNAYTGVSRNNLAAPIKTIL
jgi:hypothetical protein